MYSLAQGHTVSKQQILGFYNLSDSEPESFYPRDIDSLWAHY